MSEIEPPHSHHLSAALGWLGLGNVKEAKEEVSSIPPALQNHPDVLEVRWWICAEEENWKDGLQLARSLLHLAPERSSGWLHQAYALRRVPDGGLKDAWDALLPAFNKFPEEFLIPYNLSCYACQMQQLDTARHWLKLACQIGGLARLKQIALQDSDLQPLWKEIKLL